jgi:hypothetical protein
MRGQRKGRVALGALTAAACAALLGTAPAAGVPRLGAETSDRNPGGGAFVFNVGTHESVRVCDLQRDGFSAWAYVSYGHKYENSVGATKKRGSCARRNIVAQEGRTIFLRVCLRDRDREGRGPENRFCSPWTRGTA